MKPAAIVYTSNTGHTRKYALLLGEQIGLPVYSLDEATLNSPAAARQSIWAGSTRAMSKAMPKLPAVLTSSLSAPSGCVIPERGLSEILKGKVFGLAES